VFFGVVRRGIFGVLSGVGLVALRGVSVVSGFFVMAGFMVGGRLIVVLGSFLVGGGGFLVGGGGFLRHGRVPSEDEPGT